MPRPGGTSAEGGYASSPSMETTPSDPFGTANGAPRRYYDNDSEEYGPGRRDTYASDSSNQGLTDPGYYDQNGAYDPYRACGCAATMMTQLTFPPNNSDRGHRFRRRRLRPAVWTLSRVAWHPQVRAFRFIHADLCRLQRILRREGLLPCMDR